MLLKECWLLFNGAAYLRRMRNGEIVTVNSNRNLFVREFRIRHSLSVVRKNLGWKVKKLVKQLVLALHRFTLELS